MALTAGKQSTPPLTIVFFGLGAAGSSMLICLAKLVDRDGIPVRFKVFSIDPASARDAIYHAERLMKRVEVIGVKARWANGTSATVGRAGRITRSYRRS